MSETPAIATRALSKTYKDVKALAAEPAGYGSPWGIVEK